MNPPSLGLAKRPPQPHHKQCAMPVSMSQMNDRLARIRIIGWFVYGTRCGIDQTWFFTTEHRRLRKGSRGGSARCNTASSKKRNVPSAS